MLASWPNGTGVEAGAVGAVATGDVTVVTGAVDPVELVEVAGVVLVEPLATAGVALDLAAELPPAEAALAASVDPVETPVVPLTAAVASATGVNAVLDVPAVPVAAAGSDEEPPPQEASNSAVRLAHEAARRDRLKNTSFIGVPSSVYVCLIFIKPRQKYLCLSIARNK